jgi:RNA recognition motif-containing protein
VPLTWWQKILKAIGLYKEPVRPARPEKQESIRFEEGPPREVKSNTRNARQGGASEAAPREPRERRERTERSPRTDRPERGERAEVAGTRIYLGNLSYEATEEDLKDLFKGVGTVRNVEIVYNRRTHKSKGYGFVDMLNVDEARRSVEILHDQFFMGRKLVVSGAKTKDHEDEGKDEDAREEAEARAERQAAMAAAPVAAAVAVAPAVAEEAAAEAVEEIAGPVAEPTTEEAPAEEASSEERTA